MSTWRFHYRSLAPETVVLSGETSKQAEAALQANDIPLLECILGSGDVQHVDDRTGDLSRGTHYWAPGSVLQYELVEADPKTAEVPLTPAEPTAPESPAEV